MIVFTKKIYLHCTKHCIHDHPYTRPSSPLTYQKSTHIFFIRRFPHHTCISHWFHSPAQQPSVCFFIFRQAVTKVTDNWSATELLIKTVSKAGSSQVLSLFLKMCSPHMGQVFLVGFLPEIPFSDRNLFILTPNTIFLF